MYKNKFYFNTVNEEDMRFDVRKERMRRNGRVRRSEKAFSDPNEKTPAAAVHSGAGASFRKGRGAALFWAQSCPGTTEPARSLKSMAMQAALWGGRCLRRLVMREYCRRPPAPGRG